MRATEKEMEQSQLVRMVNDFNSLQHNPFQSIYYEKLLFQQILSIY